MKEVLLAIIIFLIFLFISYKFKNLLLKVLTKWCVILSIAYFITVFLLFDGIIYFLEILRLKKIYFEFGHADESLIVLSFICYVIAIINLIVIFIKRNLNNSIHK